jgi:hypothetical protein
MITNIDTLLAILGVISTIVIGYIGVRYTLKYRKKTDIIFLKNTCASLFKAIVKNIDEIEINFQGKQIDENLILFKGTFFNNGNVDVDKSIIHKPLEIELPSDFHWKTYKVINASRGLDVELSVNDNKLIFEWDLFKEGEYITFDCLIEYKNANDAEKDTNRDVSRVLLQDMKFNHRITNLKSVNKEGSIRKPLSAGSLTTFTIILLAIVAVSYYLSIGQYFFPSYKLLHEVVIDSNNTYVRLIPEDELNIRLVDNNDELLQVISLDQLENILSKGLSMEEKSINYWTLFVAGVFSTIYLLMLIALHVSEARQRKLYKKLKAVVDSQDNLKSEEPSSLISILLK